MIRLALSQRFAGRVAAVSLTCAVLLTAATTLGIAASASGENAIVLGSAEFAPNGEGFGTEEPRRIYNGGTITGLVKKIRWQNWGAKRSHGRGLGYQYAPEGGIYDEPVKFRLKASRISTCPGDSDRAYTKLKFQAQKRPGGPFGNWTHWAGANTICSWE